jgi:Fe-S-cluster containining protein
MKKNLWDECLSCDDKCCKWDFSSPLFITPEEEEKLSGINTNHPCLFYQNDLCAVHENRPTDCRLFPFDIIKEDNKFYWIVWKLNCSIANKDREDFEPLLQQHEKEIIPSFKKYIDKYAKFRFGELSNKHKYEILREINFNL